MTILTRDEIIVCLQKLNVVGITMYQQEGIRRACEMIMRVPEWVSVEDRIPEPEIDVLCYKPSKPWDIFIDWFGSKRDCGLGVTHWMPLPKAPT